MKDFEQLLETKRFLEIVDELINKQIVNSDADFCRRIKYSPQSFNQFRKQKRNVTVEIISKMLTIFHANPVYILSGEGEKFIDSPSGNSKRVIYKNRKEEVLIAEPLNEPFAKIGIKKERLISFYKRNADHDREILELKKDSLTKEEYFKMKIELNEVDTFILYLEDSL